MADERMDDAARAFEDALRIDPGHVDSLLQGNHCIELLRYCFSLGCWSSINIMLVIIF